MAATNEAPLSVTSNLEKEAPKRSNDNIIPFQSLHEEVPMKKIDGTLDVGAIYADLLENEPYTKKEETKLRWRLDRRIMPIVMLNVILASADKTSSATGAL